MKEDDLQHESNDELCNLGDKGEDSFDICIDTPPVSTRNSIKRQHLSEKFQTQGNPS